MSKNVPEMQKWITIKSHKIVFDDFGDKRIDSSRIPSMPGVYVFYFLYGEIYVGSTTNLRKRIRNHGLTNFKKYWRLHELTKVKYKICKNFGCWLMLEARLIKRLKPILNIKKYGGKYGNINSF